MTTVLNTTIRPEVLRGRGAISNAVGRFEKQTRVLLDDGWDDGWRAEDDTPPALRTEVIVDATRTIIAHNKSPDISFNQSINPYRGCEHGCIYCFARPTHAYLGMSPGVDFESRLFAKPNAAALLAKELSALGIPVREARVVPDIEAEHVARFRADLVEPGRPPGHPGPLPGHPHQAGPLHRGQRE